MARVQTMLLIDEDDNKIVKGLAELRRTSAAQVTREWIDEAIRKLPAQTRRDALAAYTESEALEVSAQPAGGAE